MKKLLTLLLISIVMFAGIAVSLPALAEGSAYFNKPKGIPGYSVYQGKDYSAVYNCEYYSTHYPELAERFGYNGWLYIEHFVNEGMAKGLRGSNAFDVISYKNAYPDLRAAFGNDLKQYYLHYMNTGKAEGRNRVVGISTELGNPTKKPTPAAATPTKPASNPTPAPAATPNKTPATETSGSVIDAAGTCFYNGIDLSSVYDYNYYLSYNPDVRAVIGNDPQAAIKHFMYNGLKEGRLAKLGADWADYAFLREISYNIDKAPAAYMGIDLTPVYCYEYYLWENRDVATSFNYDPVKSVEHFALYGMLEGRQAKDSYTTADYNSIYDKVKSIPEIRKTMLEKAKGIDTSTGYLILVNKAAKQVEVYQGKKGSYATIKSIPCAIGAQRSPTPSGTYFLGSKGLYFNTGTRGRCWYFSQIKGNYLFHSQIYDRQSKPVNLIDAAMSAEVSHGCIRLYLEDAKWIYDNVPKGSTIVVY